jgi:hypothetical protein
MCPTKEVKVRGGKAPYDGNALKAWREKRLEMAFPMLPMLKIRTL